MKKITKLGKIELCPALIKSLSFADALQNAQKTLWMQKPMAKW